MPKEAPKIDPFQDGEALDDAHGEQQELSGEQPLESAEPTQQAEPQQPQEKQTTETPSKPEQAVPYPRFKEVIDQRAAAQQERDRIAKERDELKERWARMDERQKQLREANEYATQQAAQQRQAAERPDPTIDPTGAELFDLKQQIAQSNANYQALQQQFQQNLGNVQQNQVAQEHANWIQYQVQDFERIDPQYREKATKSANWRIGYWQRCGMTQEEAAQRVQAESMLITSECRKHGVNFAPLIAELAEVVDIYNARQNGGNGQARQNVNTNGANRLQQVAAGQRVQGIGHLPGGSGNNDRNFLNMSLAELSDISEADHSRLMADQGLAGRQYRAALRRADGVEDNYGGRL